MPDATPAFITEWVSFTDDDDITWQFDLTFLTSDWRCTFGQGCPGTEPDDHGARGCCAHGAHLVDDDEQRLVADRAAQLSDDVWQNRPFVSTDEDLFTLVDGDLATSRVDEACIFLNDASFAGGHGCALHIGALAAGEHPMDWKPQVCWQVPFRLETHVDDVGTETFVVRAWKRSDWGEGGRDFAHWCTEELERAGAGDEVWRHHRAELVELVGEWPVDRLEQWLTERETRVELPARRGG